MTRRPTCITNLKRHKWTLQYPQEIQPNPTIPVTHTTKYMNVYYGPSPSYMNLCLLQIHDCQGVFKAEHAKKDIQLYEQFVFSNLAFPLVTYDIGKKTDSETFFMMLTERPDVPVVSKYKLHPSYIKDPTFRETCDMFFASLCTLLADISMKFNMILLFDCNQLGIRDKEVLFYHVRSEDTLHATQLLQTICDTNHVEMSAEELQVCLSSNDQEMKKFMCMIMMYLTYRNLEKHLSLTMVDKTMRDEHLQIFERMCGQSLRYNFQSVQNKLKIHGHTVSFLTIDLENVLGMNKSHMNEFISTVCKHAKTPISNANANANARPSRSSHSSKKMLRTTTATPLSQLLQRPSSQLLQRPPSQLLQRPPSQPLQRPTPPNEQMQPNPKKKLKKQKVSPVTTKEIVEHAKPYNGFLPLIDSHVNKPHGNGKGNGNGNGNGNGKGKGKGNGKGNGKGTDEKKAQRKQQRTTILPPIIAWA